MFQDCQMPVPRSIEEVEIQSLIETGLQNATVHCQAAYAAGNREGRATQARMAILEAQKAAEAQRYQTAASYLASAIRFAFASDHPDHTEAMQTLERCGDYHEALRRTIRSRVNH